MFKSLIGLIAFILLVLGLVFYVFIPQIPWLSSGSGALGLGLAVAWLFLEREAIWGFLTKKSTRYGANLALVVFLVVGILVFINVLARDYSFRKDITKLKVNTLSEQSIKIVRELKEDVNIIYLANDDQKEAAEILLKRYAHINKRFKYEILNPNRYPTRVQALGVERIEKDMLVFMIGAKKSTVQGISEEKITNGLVKILKTKSQTVGFIVGHNEYPIDAPETVAESLAFFKTDLEKEAFVTKEIQLVAEGKLPAELSALVIMGPKSAFFPKEIEILREYLKNGGRLLVGLSLDIKNGGLANGSKQIAELLKEFGVDYGSQLLVDPTSRAANVEPQILLAIATSKDHPITKDFPSSNRGLVANFLFPLTARLTKNEASAKDFTITPLAKTTASAWAESDWASIKSGAVAFNEGKDFKGEMDLAYAVEAKSKARLIVLGTGAIGINNMFSYNGNRDLLLNSVNWLTDNVEFISIRPPEDTDGDKLNINAKVLAIIQLLVIFVIPISVVITGIWIWYRRRGR